MSRKERNLDRRKQLLVAEGALLRAEAVEEMRQVKEGWTFVARGLSVALAAVSSPLRRLWSGK